jgi:hypothetical protein
MKENDRQVSIGYYRYIGVSLILVTWYRYIVDVLCTESMTALMKSLNMYLKVKYCEQQSNLHISNSTYKSHWLPKRGQDNYEEKNAFMAIFTHEKYGDIHVYFKINY